jgi:hypothetical protein
VAKLKELEAQELSKSEFEYQYQKITEKSCTCVGLGTAALLAYNLDTKVEGEGVSICPGPNMAYFSKITSLATMIDHVYGRTNVISRTDRPNMFVKELHIYLEYYKEQIAEYHRTPSEKLRKQLMNFGTNLLDGIAYYEQIFVSHQEKAEPSPTCISVQLYGSRIILNSLMQLLEVVEEEVVS